MWSRVISSVTLIGLAALLLWLAGTPPARPAADQDPTRVAAGAAKEATPAPALTAVKLATSRVAAVTVYPNNALVTRVGS
jgi:hypothetical protein